MGDREEPQAEDVDRTFRLIRRKFEFLTTLSQSLQVPTTWEAPPREDIDTWLLNHFAGQQVRPQEILSAYEAEYSIPLERRTLERHLHKVAQSVKFGVWAFPGPTSVPDAEDTYGGSTC
jgi:hypothetical protein